MLRDRRRARKCHAARVSQRPMRVLGDALYARLLDAITADPRCSVDGGLGRSAEFGSGDSEVEIGEE